MKLHNCLALALAAVLVGAPVSASHLSEQEVVALETECEKLRQQKLAPEKAALLKECTTAGTDRAECEQRAGAHGERQVAPIMRPGKYYDLPACEEAHRARKHFDINPG